MTIASKQTMWSKPSNVQFLTWVQSDGNAVIPTNFSFTSGTEKITLVASTTVSLNTHTAILYAGESGYTGYNSNMSQGFIFLNKNGDRQTIVFYGNSRWWNSTANASNWNDGNMHTITMYKLSGQTPVLTLDNTNIAVVNEGSTSSQPSAVGSGHLCVFGSDQTTDPSVNGNVKIARVKIESQSGTILADFHAAYVNRKPGLYDAVANTFYPAVNGTLSYGAPIITGNKTFNVNGLVDSGLTVPINGLTDMTLFSWVKPSSSWNYASIAGWKDTGSWGATYFGRNENTMEVRFGSGSGTSKRQYTYSIMFDEWHHYCFVRQGSNYLFYVDGQLQQTQTNGGTAALKNNGVFKLTEGMNADTNYDMSYVSYGAFSRALTAAEVQQVYQAGANINTSSAPFNNGLILGLSLTEGSGNIVHDVASGNNITLTGNVVWDVSFDPA